MSTKKRISVDVHPDAFERLSAIAVERRATVPEVCRAAIDVFLLCQKAKREGRRVCFVSDGVVTEMVISGVFLED